MSDIQDRVKEGQVKARILAARAKLEAALAQQQNPTQVPLSTGGQQGAGAGIFEGTPFAANVRANIAERAPGVEARATALKEMFRNNAPAIGATIATLARRGRPAIQPNLRLPTNIMQALNRVIAKPSAVVAASAGRAAVGGGVGGLVQGGETPALDRFVNNAIEQGVADPLARLTLGFSKFLLRPATKVTAKSIERVMDFARKEGLPLDPGRVTNSAIPKMIATFSRGFFGSTIQSRMKLRAITELISSNPEDVGSLVRAILKKGPGLMPQGGAGKFLTDLQGVVVKMAARLRGRATPLMKRAAQTNNAGEAAELIFRDAATTTQAKANMTTKQWKNLVTAQIDNMIKRSESSGIIDGDKLAALIRENRTNLSQFFPSGLLGRLENLAVYAKAHRGVLEEVAEAPFLNQRSFRVNIIGGAIAGGSMAAGADPTGISTAVIGLSTALASQVFNPNSITSKWLTTGLIPRNIILAATADVVANVATRRVIGDVATAVGGTEAIRERSLIPIQDRIGESIDTQVKKFR